MCARKTAKPELSNPETAPELADSETAAETTPPEESTHLYVTSHTTYAAYILAKSRLRYCGCRTGKFGIDFMFEDPKHEGGELLRAYNARTADPAEPVSLFDAYSFLRSEVRRIQLMGVDSER
jgi:hypothetical protein